MNCYIIPVGGTGSRVMRAVTHLMASGAFGKIKDLNEVHFMCVDSDATNGDKKRMENTVQKYIDLNNAHIVSRRLVRPFSREADLNRFTWSPLDTPGATMADIEDYTLMNENTKEVYDFLYTEEEKNLPLIGGFYSHTSIGSYYMTSGIADNNGYIGDWKEFFNTVQQNDKIIIICSMFGGTGASGVPTLARKIREVQKTSQCAISGIFVEPYFRTVNPDGKPDIIDWNAFSIKSKIAFEYYHNQDFHNTIFDKMYFIGEDANKLMPVAHNIDAEHQCNKANMIELYAATAIVDFLASQVNKGQEIAWRGTPNVDSVFDRNLLNNVAGIKVYDRLARFFQFSVLYTKFLFHCIMRNEVKKCRFLKYYNFFENGGISQAVADLYDYCMMYITWMREIITDARPDGSFHGDNPWELNAPDSQTNPYANWFPRDQFFLYDGQEVQAQTYLDRCYVLDAYQNTAYPGFTGVIVGKVSTSSANVFTQLCNQPHKFIEQKKNLNQFVGDVMRLTEGRALKQ